MAHREFVWLGLFKKTLLLELSHNQLSRFKTILTAKPRYPFSGFTACEKRVRIDARVGIEDADLIQTESFTDLEIVEVVPRRNLQCPRTKGTIDIGISDDRHNSSADGQTNILPDPLLVTLVVRMHSKCRVPEHCFRPGSCDDQRRGRFAGQWGTGARDT